MERCQPVASLFAAHRLTALPTENLRTDQFDHPRWEEVRKRGRRRSIAFGFRLEPAHRAYARLQRDIFQLRYGT